MRTLHKRGLDKRQTPDPGEEEVDLARFLVGFLKFLCRALGSVHSLEDATGGGVSGVWHPGLLDKVRLA
jgi:hypothetical protein